MVQDLSKAYDRVDIPLLERALKRVNIPQHIINFFLALFTNRTNQVIFNDWIGDPYEVHTGIDQGESICPLLWVIYYDPIFEAINQSPHKGIDYTAQIPKTCYFPKPSDQQDVDYIKESLSFKVLGYLDDTTWLAEDLEQLKHNLIIADNFYQLANIHINKDKTIILANRHAKKLLSRESSTPVTYIDIDFGSTIRVPVLAKDKATRILGVHFNVDDCHKYSIKKIYNTIRYVTTLIKKKRLTHDHVIYVINKVIIPRVEYLSQHFMLTTNQCNKINISLRSTLKHSLSLPKSTFNTVFHSSIYPHIVNFFDHQLKVQSSLMVAQANCPHTSNILKFLFLLTQQKFFLPNSPINFFDLFDQPLKYFSRIESLLTFFKFYNLSLSSNFKFTTRGGNFPIAHYVIDPCHLFAHLNSLKTKGIMFLDHIITKDNAFLVDYNEIKAQLEYKGGKIPRWYKFLKDNITLNNQGRLMLNFDKPLIQNPTAPRPSVPPVSDTTHLHQRRSQQWVAAWVPHLTNIIYGKILSTSNFPDCTPISYLEHWIHQDVSPPQNDNTPRSIPNTIIRCPGCSSHYSYYVGDLRPKCIIQIKHKDLILTTCLSKKKKEDLIRSPNVPFNSFQLLKFSHPHYRLLAYNDFLIQQNHNSTIDFRPVGVPQENINNDNIRTNIRLINSLFQAQNIKDELGNIAFGLSTFPQLDFYTDGSFNDDTSEESFPMGYGWTTSNLDNVNFTYNGSIQYFPSSTKAETMAILTCLAVCPQSCTIRIYTDSQAAIDSFHKSKNLSSISPRRFNKINNNILWSTIHHLIRELGLIVKLFKVKAHSNNHFNDLADVQAKLGRLQPTPTQICHDHLPHQTLTIKWNDNIPLDKDVRKCVGTILNYRRIETHLNHRSLEHVKRATKENLIDWSLSTKWFNYNGRNDSTTEKHSKDTKWKIRCSTLSLPTKDILHRNYPLLLPEDKLNCFFCADNLETNEHFWTCPQMRDMIIKIFKRLGQDLIILINKYADKHSLLINDSIKYSQTFRWAYRNEPIHPAAILLMKSYVSRDMVGIFRSHFTTIKTITTLLLPFIHHCSLIFKSDLWKVRNEKWKTLRSELGWTKKDFIDYRKNLVSTRPDD
ncbi:unnamed protein product [Rhizophagus irregularis]|nr:unnamed protein product [Rhizophagus irregularis]